MLLVNAMWRAIHCRRVSSMSNLSLCITLNVTRVLRSTAAAGLTMRTHNHTDTDSEQ
jgi:hypothetical protein